MSRVYAIESTPTLLGSVADHRFIAARSASIDAHGARDHGAGFVRERRTPDIDARVAGRRGRGYEGRARPGLRARRRLAAAATCMRSRMR